MRSIVPVSLCFLALTAGAAAAQSWSVEPPEIVRHGAVQSHAGFSTREPFSGDWQVVDIFAVPDPQVRDPYGRPVIEHVARRRSGIRGSPGDITWATTRDCASLRNTLIWMTVLVAPRIEISGVNPSEAEPAGRRPITATADGLYTVVWGRGSQPDHSLNAEVRVASNGGLIADFGRAASANLEPCWQPDEPDLP